jgi:hypothetical protein
MKIIVTEQQYLKILENVFNTLYTEVRYRKIRNTIFVYNGKSLVRTLWLNVGSRDSIPNTLMDYSDFGGYGRLTVYDRGYYEMVKWAPMLEYNELFLKFFKEWFEKKFKKPVDSVVIGNKSIMDNLKNPFE